jgi:putative transcriptional regulator
LFRLAIAILKYLSNDSYIQTKMAGIRSKMTSLLQNKRLMTKFQILVEIAAGQPYIRQKDIAKKVHITPQAVSQYMLELVRDGWVQAESGSNHRVAKEGVNWLLKTLGETQSYLSMAEKIIRNTTVCTAIAQCNISEGETIGLAMENGLFLAIRYTGKGAKGIAVTPAIEGEDVGVASIEGIIGLELGEVIILGVPSIQKGGSRQVDLERLKAEIGTNKFIGAIGTEAIIALKKIGIAPRYVCGVKEVVVDAAQRGLSTKVVCVDKEIPYLVQSLEQKHLAYKLLEQGKVKVPK